MFIKILFKILAVFIQFLNVHDYLNDIFINITGFSVTGGATYCAIASLRLMGFIEDNVLSSHALSSLIDVQLLLDWILQVRTSKLFQFKLDTIVINCKQT